MTRYVLQLPPLSFLCQTHSETLRREVKAPIHTDHHKVKEVPLLLFGGELPEVAVHVQHRRDIWHPRKAVNTEGRKTKGFLKNQTHPFHLHLLFQAANYLPLLLQLDNFHSVQFFSWCSQDKRSLRRDELRASRAHRARLFLPLAVSPNYSARLHVRQQLHLLAAVSSDCSRVGQKWRVEMMDELPHNSKWIIMVGTDKYIFL